MKPKLRFTTLFSNTHKEKFEDIKSTTAILDACLVKGNSKYAALSWLSSGGGALAILDIKNPSRLPYTFPMIKGHSGVIMDFDFYPFNEDIIITASEDASLKLWNIPAHITEDLIQPAAKLTGHAKKVNLVQFHPTAESTVASASFDYSVKVWNVETQSALCTIKGTQESFMSLEWNPSGSRILTSCRDKKVRFGDPRSGAWEQEFRGHEGPKTQKSVWLGEKYVATVGFSKSFGREMYLWNVSNLNDPVQTLSLDQAAGTLYPFYDEDCRVLYLAGKGDGNIRYFEFADGQLYNLNQHTSTVPQKGIGFLPKRCVDTTQNELMKCLKLTNTTLEFVSFNAMRKSECFQEDLYPPCPSGEPSLKAEEWVSGKNAEPKRRSMNPETSGHTKTGGSAINISAAPVQTQVQTHTYQQSHVQQSHVAHPVQIQADSGLKEKVSKLESELADTRVKIDQLGDERAELYSQNNQLKLDLMQKNRETDDLRAQIEEMRALLESQAHISSHYEPTTTYQTYDHQQGEQAFEQHRGNEDREAEY